MNPAPSRWRAIVSAIAMLAVTLPGTAQSRNAMALSPDGHGQVLVYPYYTVNGGNLTLLTIENTRDEAKAVRVRFRESLNGRIVLQLNLYLGPQDMWTAAITPAAGIGAPNGTARLQTADPSCTMPAIPAGGLDFSRLDYIDASASGGANRQDHPNALLTTHSAPERTRAGSIEVIEMGVLRPGPAATQLAEEVTAVAPADPTTQPAFPVDCGAIVRAWQAGQGGWADVGASRDVALPRGGLAGTAAIVDVADGTLMGYRPEAIAGFHANEAAPGALHHAPDAAAPDLGDCDHGNGRCDILLPMPGGITHRFVFEAGGARAWDAVSTLFMAELPQAEFVTEAGIAGRTELVLTGPTRQFYVDRSDAVRAPYQALFAVAGTSCVPYLWTHVNRESIGVPLDYVDGQPLLPPISQFPRPCQQSSVVTFNESGDTSSVLGTSRRFAINRNTSGTGSDANQPAVAPEMANGFAYPYRAGPIPVPLAIELDTQATFGGPQRYGQVIGVPWSGIAFRTAINANAQPGVLARYGAVWGASRLRSILPPSPPVQVVKDTPP
jgi:hypothetical protein